jgi:hypothetical protein
MVVYSATITPTENEGWYLVTITSTKAAWGLGQTKIELIVNESTLGMLRNQIAKILGEKPDYSNLPEKLKRFMEGE